MLEVVSISFQNNIAEVKEFRGKLMREDFLMMTK